MKHMLMIGLIATGATGCATVDAAPAEPVRVGAEGACDAAGVQDRIGQMATAQLGAELLAETGARQLRWGPPRSAMTMDFRPDRLTVSYDDNMMIERISCG